MLRGSYERGVRLIGGGSTNSGCITINCDEFYLTDNVRILFQECNLMLEDLFIRCRRRLRVCSCLSYECFGSIVVNEGRKWQISNTGAGLVENTGWVV